MPLSKSLEDLAQACREASRHLENAPLAEPVMRRLRRDPVLREQAALIEALLDTCGEVYRPEAPALPSGSQALKAVTWNIERGKRFEAVARTLASHPELNDADVYFLTEVDWGMARSGNRNVAAELGEVLGLHAYFAPSYFNLTAGHGSERHITQANELGLHGKAILSRRPLENLRVASMTNATDKRRSKEVRLGRKRSLIGEIATPQGRVTAACVHLDAFSSPRMRARQFQEAVAPLLNGRSSPPALVAGDWNTNTMNSTSGRTLFLSALRQLILPGPNRMIRSHHAYPDRKFDKPLFRTLKELGLDYEGFNEEGVGTFDLVTDDLELGQMAKDQFPEWVLRWINRIVAKSGGRFSLKLDWFAGRGLRPLLKKVIRLNPEDGPTHGRPSDHHPILLSFEI